MVSGTFHFLPQPHKNTILLHILGLIFIIANSVCKIELYVCIMSHVKPRNYTHFILRYSVVNHLDIYKQHDCAKKEARFSFVSQIMSISHSKNAFS